jgi:inorganic triphosphatase YgiF
LQSVFRTRVSRTLWTIERDQAQIEVALDVGEITVQVSGEPVREPISELELELKRGDATALIDFALDLIDGSGKAPLPLLPLARSKAERGYQLASLRQAVAVKASAKGFTEKLTRKMSFAQALRAVMAHGLSVVTVNCELLLRADDPEYVHQARVALRRVRSAVRLFDRAGRDVPRDLRNELKWLADALGAVRDWDVFVDQTLPQLARTVGDDLITGGLCARAAQRRRDERVKLRAAVSSTRYAALILNGERWSMSRAPADSELLEVTAHASLQRAAKKMFKPARFFAALTPGRRHFVRIQAKRFRYAMDLFAAALPKRSAANYVDALSHLQDILGELNDAAVALSMLRQLSRSARVEQAVRAAFASHEQQHVIEAEKSLLALSKLTLPRAAS